MTNNEALIEYARTIHHAAAMLAVDTDTDYRIEQGLPAPVIKDLTDYLGPTMSHLRDMLGNAAAGLKTSLETHVLDDESRPPAESVALAVAEINQARELLLTVGARMTGIREALYDQTVTRFPWEPAPVDIDEDPTSAEADLA